jgi:hypothetical protein
MNGAIQANGGAGRQVGTVWSGAGSGGSILVVADRVSGTGSIFASGGVGSSGTGNAGRVRIEGYLRPFLGTTAGISPQAVEAPPLIQRFGGANNSGSLRITQVAGEAVPETLSGSFDSPDVVFQQTGTVNIVVSASNLPDGTEIGCRITVAGQIITLPSSGTVTLNGGTASFSTTVPPGLGTIQAFTRNFSGQ